MPPTKRKAQDAELEGPPSKKPRSSLPPLEVWGTAENLANANKAFLTIPMELTTEILSHFPAIDAHTCIRNGQENPVLPTVYLERPDILRALSQTCIAYRRAFLPLLFENFDACVGPRVEKSCSFFRHAGTTLKQKSDGLLENTDLATYVGRANLILTRYQTNVILPPLTACLRALPNLHTIHVLHAHTQMTTAIKDAFQGVVLPQIRTLIIPGYGHELLKSCPEVRSVRCIRDDGSKLVTVIAKYCKHVEEMMGFSAEERLIKRIVKAAPDLTTIGIPFWSDEPAIKLLSGLKKLTTIEIETNVCKGDPYPRDLEKRINASKAILKPPGPKTAGAPNNEKKYLRLIHIPIRDRPTPCNRPDITQSEIDLIE